MNNNIILNLPPYINIIILKNQNNLTYVYIYNDIKYMYFVFKNNDVYKYDSETNSLNILKLNLNKNSVANINHINKFLKSLNIYFFFKLKFKGKGYRIRFYKKNKIVKFYFGKSHITFYFFKKLILKKINKYKFVLKSLNFEKLKSMAVSVTKIKPINKYTLRGLRISRQKIYKRRGKKGSYI